MVLLAFGACKKDESVRNLTDLHNTEVYVLTNGGGIDYNLDIDKDNITDLIITAYDYFSNYSGVKSYIKINPENGYEVAFTDYIAETWEWNPSMSDTIFQYDTLMIPKTFNFGDKIIIDDDYSPKFSND